MVEAKHNMDNHTLQLFEEQYTQTTMICFPLQQAIPSHVPLQPVITKIIRDYQKNKAWRYNKAAKWCFCLLYDRCKKNCMNVAVLGILH